MSVREYIGARYVPIFGRVGETSIEWDNTKPYEPLTIVLYQGNSYTSRQYVPVGIDIDNENFWALTGNYNAQVEAYRAEVAAVADALPVEDFSSENTVKDAIDDAETAISGMQDDVSDLKNALPIADFDAVNTVKAAIQDVSDSVSGLTDYDFVSGVIDIDDWEIFAGFGLTKVQSMAYDSDTDTLFAAVYPGSGMTVTVHKFENFSQHTPNTQLVSDGSLNITNNHGNAMSVRKGVLYVFSWNGNYISRVDIATFTALSDLVYGHTIRTGAMDDNMFVLQPYVGNKLNMQELNPSVAEIPDIRLNPWFQNSCTENYSYVQDSTMFNYCFYRLMSVGIPQSKSYIECYSMNSNASAPIVYTIPLEDREYEGITFANGQCYICSGSYIWRSTKVVTYKPQVANSQMTTRTFENIIYASDGREAGLAKDVIVEGRTWNFSIPNFIHYTAMYGATRLLNPSVKLALRIYRLDGHLGSFALIPLNILDNIDATNPSTGYNFTMITATSTGYQLYRFLVGMDNSANSGDYNHHVCISMRSAVELNVSTSTFTDITGTAAITDSQVKAWLVK